MGVIHYDLYFLSSSVLSSEPQAKWKFIWLLSNPENKEPFVSRSFVSLLHVLEIQSYWKIEKSGLYYTNFLSLLNKLQFRHEWYWCKWNLFNPVITFFITLSTKVTYKKKYIHLQAPLLFYIFKNRNCIFFLKGNKWAFYSISWM